MSESDNEREGEGIIMRQIDHSCESQDRRGKREIQREKVRRKERERERER